MSIYVEILVRAPLETLWAHTQTPELHQQWDLRFSKIEYLPKAHAGAPQKFRYTTRIGFGVEVSGEGETTGQRNLVDGSRSSALRFGSAETLSIIRHGSGYWKYIPTAHGIRFLTSYDYQTRFGRTGALFDRWIFRPIMGWATAFSFDRLRLWLEDGVHPAQALRQAIVHFTARFALTVVFAYQALVPKLFRHNPDELAMLRDTGIAVARSGAALNALGVAELGFAVVLLVAWNRLWPPALCLVSMFAATFVVAAYSPRYFEAAFNPITLNIAVAALAAIDLLVLGRIPSAMRCLRRPPEES